MKKVLIIGLIVAIATAILTSCNTKQQVLVYNSQTVYEAAYAPILNNIRADLEKIIKERDSIMKLPEAEQDKNKLKFLQSQIIDAENISERKYYQAVAPIEEAMNKKIKAAIKSTVEELKGTIVEDVSVNPAQAFGNNNVDITDKIIKKIK